MMPCSRWPQNQHPFESGNAEKKGYKKISASPCQWQSLISLRKIGSAAYFTLAEG